MAGKERKRAKRTPSSHDKSKDYFTARISTEVERQFREAIPEGYGFGESVEAALRLWAGLAEGIRIDSLARRAAYSLDEILRKIVDEQVEAGIRSGRFVIRTRSSGA